MNSRILWFVLFAAACDAQRPPEQPQLVTTKQFFSLAPAKVQVTDLQLPGALGGLRFARS